MKSEKSAHDFDIELQSQAKPSTRQNIPVVAWDRQYLMLGSSICLLMALLDSFASLFASDIKPFTLAPKFVSSVFSISSLVASLGLYHFTRKEGKLHAEFSVVLSMILVPFLQIMFKDIMNGQALAFYCVAWALVCVKASYALRGIVKSSGFK